MKKKAIDLEIIKNYIVNRYNNKDEVNLNNIKACDYRDITFYELSTADLGRGNILDKYHDGRPDKRSCVDSIKVIYNKEKNTIVVQDELVNGMNNHINDSIYGVEYCDRTRFSLCYTDKYKLIETKIGKRLLHITKCSKSSTGIDNSFVKSESGDMTYSNDEILLRESALVDDDYTLSNGLDGLVFEEYVINETNEPEKILIK